MWGGGGGLVSDTIRASIRAARGNELEVLWQIPSSHLNSAFDKNNEKRNKSRFRLNTVSAVLHF
jgi:hypothetical protein